MLGNFWKATSRPWPYQPRPVWPMTQARYAFPASWADARPSGTTAVAAEATLTNSRRVITLMGSHVFRHDEGLPVLSPEKFVGLRVSDDGFRLGVERDLTARTEQGLFQIHAVFLEVLDDALVALVGL